MGAFFLAVALVILAWVFAGPILDWCLRRKGWTREEIDSWRDEMRRRDWESRHAQRD